MRKILKKITGYIFVNLIERDKNIISQRILIVDNGYTTIHNLELAVEKAQINFPNSDIILLTFKHRECEIENCIPDVKIILPSRILIKKYQIAIHMLKLAKEKFDYIVLFSLDITPVIVSLFFMRKNKIVLYNKYFQWWVLRFRNVGEKLEYVPKRYNFLNPKRIIKKVTNNFIYLSHTGEEILKHKILIVDNSKVDIHHMNKCIDEIISYLPECEFFLLTSKQRECNFEKLFNVNMVKKYEILHNLSKARRKVFDYIILPSLDVFVVIRALCFLKKYKILLYNKWHQWWEIRFKNPVFSIFNIPKFVLKFIFHFIIFIYLLIVVFFIFLKKSFNMLFLKTNKDIC